MSIAEKLQTIAENEQKVYDKGYEDGKAEGGGGSDDAFWDAYQDNGNRKGYAYAFAGTGWTADTFKPKYDIRPTTTVRRMLAGALEGLDLERLLTDLGVTFDTSGVTSVDGFDQFIEYACPSVLPVIDTTGVSALRNTFCYPSNLVTIRKLILKSDGSQTFNNPFPGCTKLENIEIEGVIGNKFDISSATKLSAASIESIMGALSTTASGKSITLSFVAVDKAFETSEGANDGRYSDAWKGLCFARNNWSISIV